MSHFRTLRGRLTALALVGAFLSVAGLTTAFNLLLRDSLRADADGRLRAQAAAASTTVSAERGRLRVRESTNDNAVDRQVWVFAGRRVVERPPAARALQRAAAALSGASAVFAEVAGSDVRLYAHALVEDGRRVGTVVAGQSLTAYDRTTDLALIGSLALAGLLLAAVGVLTWITIGRALAPVRAMTRSAADWSEHHSDRRFGTTRREDELGELAHTFDALLDRVAASLRHEQRLSAELSHELRTPLSRISAEIELLERRERDPEERRAAHASIALSARQMSEILETLMAAARADADLDPGRSELGDTLARLRAGWAPALAERQIALALAPLDAPLYAGADPEVVERIVAPLLDNAQRYARSRVELAARPEHGRVEITVTDDGPGVAPGAEGAVFDPGRRGEEENDHRGAGLGLALARRLARAAGGDVTLGRRAGTSGAEFRVELPG